MNFSSNELKDLMAITSQKHYNKKELLLLPEAEETVFRFVKKGIARMYYVLNDSQINVQFAKENDILCCYTSYMLGNTAGYYIETVTPCEIYSINRCNMDKLLMTNPKYLEWAKKLTAELYHSKCKRELELLSYNAFERIERFMDSQPELFLTLPQTQIASYLNVTSESFSTLKRELMQKNGSNRL